MRTATRNSLQQVAIEDFCDTGSGGTLARSNASQYFGGSIPWVKSGELRESVITSTEETITEAGLSKSAAKLLPKNTLLVALYGATVGRIGVLGIEAATNQAVCHIIPDEQRADRTYLYYALQSQVPFWLSKRVGGGQPTISQGIVKKTKIPLPPLSEQKRIADILDKADAIRRKRQEAASHTASMRRSLFLELFGDPAINAPKWESAVFNDLLAGGMRNGISPSKCGTFPGKVLVLSAITGSTYNSAAVKVGTFDAPFSGEQLVDKNDFLICRGNGNISLVGSGHFPERSLNDTVFPDTIIAARIDPQRLDAHFLEELWSTRHVRGQIEAGARTTNGTHKVNQQMLSTISFPLPPIDKQKRFSQFVSKIADVQRRFDPQLSDNLFNSLVQRAFKGEL